MSLRAVNILIYLFITHAQFVVISMNLFTRVMFNKVKKKKKKVSRDLDILVGGVAGGELRG